MTEQESRAESLGQFFEFFNKLHSFVPPDSVQVMLYALTGNIKKLSVGPSGERQETDWTLTDLIDRIQVGQENDERATRSGFYRDLSLLCETMGDTNGLTEEYQLLLANERDFLWQLMLCVFSKPNIKLATLTPLVSRCDRYSAALLEASRRTLLTGCSYLLYENIGGYVPDFDEDAWYQHIWKLQEQLGLHTNNRDDACEIQQKHVYNTLATMTPDEWVTATDDVQKYIGDYLHYMIPDTVASSCEEKGGFSLNSFCSYMISKGYVWSDLIR